MFSRWVWSVNTEEHKIGINSDISTLSRALCLRVTQVKLKMPLLPPPNGWNDLSALCPDPILTPVEVRGGSIKLDLTWANNASLPFQLICGVNVSDLLSCTNTAEEYFFCVFYPVWTGQRCGGLLLLDKQLKYFLIILLRSAIFCNGFYKITKKWFLRDENQWMWKCSYLSYKIEVNKRKSRSYILFQDQMIDCRYDSAGWRG